MKKKQRRLVRRCKKEIRALQFNKKVIAPHQPLYFCLQACSIIARYKQKIEELVTKIKI